MVFLLIFIALLSAVLLYLLLAPLYLEVNSVNGICRIRLHRAASLRIYITEESLYLEVIILGWHKIIDLAAIKAAPEKVKKISRNKGHRISVHKIMSVIRSFKLNKCYAAVDTGNMSLNGILYPGIWYLSQWIHGDLRINFQDENEIILEIENNCFRMLRAYVVS